MPYTPPSRSPASSNANSPVLSRNHSYEGPISAANRPGLPRSRSAAYIQKHRRSPSASDHQSSPVATIYESTTAVDHSLHRQQQQAPPPPPQKQNGTTPSLPEAVDQLTGETSTVSPSDSPVVEEDEEEQRGRGKQIQDLANSLKNLVLVKRSASPEREKNHVELALAQAAATSNGSTGLGLTPAARKIAHSRSSSEIQLSKLTDVPSQAASSDSEDDELHIKPPMVRKKSGELVKPALRPPSRRRPSSMPGTPTFSKAVHFNEDIEQVRHFLQVDRPSAVSANSSPVETYDSESEYPFGGVDRKSTNATEWEIRLANFPKDTRERETAAVRVERIFLAADQKMLVGVIACANIAFSKHVVARFTFDYWKTTSEVTAEFNHDVRKKELNDGYDRFNFNIKLADQAHLENKTLFICVRYNVAGQEHWDNNSNMNYQVDFVKKVVPRKASTSAGAGTLGTIPRSRHNPHSSPQRPRSFPSNDDDLVTSFEFGAGTTTLQDPLNRRTRPRNNSIYPTQRKRGSPQTGGAFGTRYDFGASLSAALTRAQSQMGQPAPPQQQVPLGRSKSTDHVHKMSSLAPRTAAPAVQPVTAPNPAKISSDRPELGSQEYHDLIQKFCYFGSKTGSPGANSPDVAPKSPANTNAAADDDTAKLAAAAAKEASTSTSSSFAQQQQQTDGPAHSIAATDSDESAPNSVSSSVSNSPPTERLERSQVDGPAHDASHRSSRSSTPSSFHSTTSPRLIAQYRSPSPALVDLPQLVSAQ